MVFLLCEPQIEFALAAKFEMKDMDREIKRSFEVLDIFTSSGSFSYISWVKVATILVVDLLLGSETS